METSHQAANLSQPEELAIQLFIENFQNVPGFCYGHVKQNDIVDFVPAEDVRGTIEFTEKSPFGNEKTLRLEQALSMAVVESEDSPKDYLFDFSSDNKTSPRHHRLTLDGTGGLHRQLSFRFEEGYTALIADLRETSVSVVSIANKYGAKAEFQMTIGACSIWMGLDNGSTLWLPLDKDLKLSDLKGPDEGQSGGTAHVEIIIEGPGCPPEGENC